MSATLGRIPRWVEQRCAFAAEARRMARWTQVPW